MKVKFIMAIITIASTAFPVLNVILPTRLHTKPMATLLHYASCCAIVFFPVLSLEALQN